MTGAPREDNEDLGFMKIMADGSQEIAKAMWDEMMTTLKPSVRELQLKTPKVQPRDLSSNKPIEYWVLASSQPELGPDGEVISIMGSITDISHLKWAQGNLLHKHYVNLELTHFHQLVRPTRNAHSRGRGNEETAERVHRYHVA
jgi:hypothetical protein